jgi:hypothetical protein
MDHFRHRDGTLAPVDTTFPTEEMKMQTYYDEFAAEQAITLKKHMNWEPQETTVMRGNYQKIRAYE